MKEQLLTEVTDQMFKDKVFECQQPAIVGFIAKWSGPCHILKPVMESLAFQYKNRLIFYQVDFDKCHHMVETYGVRDVPTLLFFKNGQVQESIKGITPRSIINQKILTLLASKNHKA